MDQVKLFTDGGSRGNPGPGAIAVLVVDGSDVEVDSYRECIGITTSNRAEYRALIKGLEVCARHTRGRVACYSDSQLLVNQVNGAWRLTNGDLQKLCSRVKEAAAAFDEVTYAHLPRENSFMKKVDRAVNDALDGQ